MRSDEELGIIFRDECGADPYGDAYEVYPKNWEWGATAVRLAVLDDLIEEADKKELMLYQEAEWEGLPVTVQGWGSLVDWLRNIRDSQ